MEWSLKELYESFDSQKYQDDLQSIKQLAVEVEEFAQKELTTIENSVEKCEKVIRYNEQVSYLIVKTATYASLVNAAQADNEQSLYYLNHVQELSNEFVKPNVAFQMFLKQIDNLDGVIHSSEFLKNYAFYLKEIKEKSNYLLSEKEEMLISKMVMSGSTAWSNLQNKISSTLNVDVELEGKLKQLPLPAIRNLAYHSDPIVRKAGYDAEMVAYKQIEESSAAAINAIKGEVNTLTAWRGYDSALDETLLKSRLDKESLDAMLVAIEEALPSFHQYYKHKAKLLNHTNGLPFYELFAPIKETSLTYTYKEAMDYIIKQFATFSDELAAYTKHAYDHKWLDVTPRAKKRGGAFCSNIHPIKESRILSNFDGSFSNLTTLAHELGHGYHGYQLKDESILNSRYPMPLAETASIFCETIVINAAKNQASEQEKIAILESSISDAGQVIVDIYSRYLFESSVFDKRKAGVLSVNQLKELMMDAQRKAYGDGLDHDVLHPYMWLNKPHYYSAGLSFYNFPYAFGLLFSKGLYAQYLNEKERFVEKYDRLLKATGKNNIKDVAKMADVDISNPAFFRQSLELIKQDIQEFIALTS